MNRRRMPEFHFEQLERIICTFGALRSRRYPATIVDIARDVGERMGTNYHQRTTKRDLALLERLGMAEPSGKYHGRKWSLVTPLSFFEAASVRLGGKAGAA